MVKIFYANSDSTLYESAPDINTGLDEVLDIGKRLFNSGSNYLKSRALVKFDVTEIESALEKYNTNIDSCKFVLQMFTTDAKNLPAEYTIDANVVGQSWVNGTGLENSNPNPADGVSWNYTVSGSNWISGS